jgi:HSP20 family protein
MFQIDEAIGHVENLYRALTGKQCAELGAPYAPIPEGADPDAHVQKQWDRLLAALAGAPPPTMMRRRAAWIPPISVVETNSEVLFYVDLPGVSREQVNVSLEGGFLVIEGQRAFEPSNADRPPRVFGDRPSGPFRRQVALPVGLELAQMSARLVDGVLEIRIPRVDDGPLKQIPIT